jgi:hypothetical protein
MAMWRLCSRLGYSSWFSLAMLVPLANILLLYFLAFADWPAGPRPIVRPLGSGNGPLAGALPAEDVGPDSRR